ncbi:ATP-binding protein [Neptunomonas phycophila]|uniref:ATP-binding protein n=1 Tax=Neptunomonas phycophila TaxID=1572645 RepID=UPI0030F7DC50
MEVKLPNSFKPESLTLLEKRLKESQLVNDVNVDFSSLYWSYPMAMLVAGSYFRRWIKVRRDNDLKTTYRGISKSRNAHTYLMHLGFFDYIGIKDIGNKVGSANGNTRYLPIRKISLEELNNSIAETGEKLIDAINFVAGSMARVLSGDDISETNKAFSYSIREIIRNALEHSGSDCCYICAQKWANGQSEIAIVDEGCGIYSSLSQAYSIGEKDALKHSLKPGVTRTEFLSEEENVYNNSGFGLYVLSEMGSSFGWFCIGSGTQKLIFEKQEDTVSSLDFSGTFVGVHLNSHPKSFQGVLSDIIQVGEVESEKEGRHSSASELSKRV